MQHYYNGNVGHASDVNDYESAVDGTDSGNVYKAYELAGNVWEWTNTYWYSNGQSATSYDEMNGPTAYSYSLSRVVRGGAWNLDAYWVRAASRLSGAPSYRINLIGFRAARTP